MAGLTHLRTSQKISFEYSTIKASRLRRICVYMTSLQICQRWVSTGVTQHARCEMSQNSAERTEVKRTPITQAALEAALTEAVRAHDTQCEGLVGIIVERVDPAHPGGTNWSVKGIKYGKAERDRCDIALSICVEQMQREFEVSG